MEFSSLCSFQRTKGIIQRRKIVYKQFFCMRSNFVGVLFNLLSVRDIVEVVARLEEIMGGVVEEKAVIIGALSVLEALKLNLSRL